MAGTQGASVAMSNSLKNESITPRSTRRRCSRSTGSVPAATPSSRRRAVETGGERAIVLGEGVAAHDAPRLPHVELVGNVVVVRELVLGQPPFAGARAHRFGQLGVVLQEPEQPYGVVPVAPLDRLAF